MKKFLLLGVFVVAAMLLSGCVLSYNVSSGFPRTMPGGLLAEQTSGSFIGNKLHSMKDVEVLGPVSVELSAANLLMLISEGDVSIAKAKEIALGKFPQADDVVNVEIDTKHRGVLGLFNTVTMYYRGIAVKYKR